MIMALIELKLNIINGFQTSPLFFLGFGTGLRYYFDSHAALIPLFVGIRINFIEDNTSPYLSINACYSFDASNKLQATGYLLNLIAGVSLMLSDKSAINIGLGYKMQRMEFYGYWSYETLIKTQVR